MRIGQRFLDEWDRRVLPVVTDWYTKSAAKFRKELLAEAHGRVLEIGIGSGPSLPFYSTRVTELVGLEPNETARRKLERRLQSDPTPFPVRAVDGSALELPFESRSFDAVTFQLVLCTVPGPEKALAEARRVLKPDGRLLFVEHVRHTQPRSAALQDRISPAWSVFAGGCRLNQDTEAIIRQTGFAVDWIKHVENRTRPHFLSHMVWGVAHPAPQAPAR